MTSKLTVLLVLVAGSAAWGASGIAALQPAPAEELTDKVRGFLKKEMRLLADGGRVIEQALEANDSKAVAEVAAKMRETFVHKDEVTTLDLRVLQAVLGEDFVARDKAFHDLARKLELMAKNGDITRQRALFGQMLEACAVCHKAYAPDAPVLE